MALQLNFTNPDTGVNLPTAYWRVEKITIERSGVAEISFACYADATNAAAGKNAVTTREFQFTGDVFTANFAPTVLDTMNPIKAAYVYCAKSLPLFAGATSV